jgi:hypothetical protein
MRAKPSIASAAPPNWQRRQRRRSSALKSRVLQTHLDGSNTSTSCRIRWKSRRLTERRPNVEMTTPATNATHPKTSTAQFVIRRVSKKDSVQPTGKPSVRTNPLDERLSLSLNGTEIADVESAVLPGVRGELPHQRHCRHRAQFSASEKRRHRRLDCPEAGMTKPPFQVSERRAPLRLAHAVRFRSGNAADLVQDRECGID